MCFLVRGLGVPANTWTEPFLEAAYLAFDLDNKQVALAPPANCGEKLVAFGSGPNAIPCLKGC